MGAHTFKDLRVWQKAFDLVILVYKATEAFPKTELYGITQQLRRASVSMPSNIAEGFRRYHNKEYRQFLYIALGSAAELETQIRLAERLGYTKEPIDQILKTIDEVCGMTTNLIKRL